MVSATILYPEHFLQAQQCRYTSSGIAFVLVKALQVKLGAKGGDFVPSTFIIKNKFSLITGS